MRFSFRQPDAAPPAPPQQGTPLLPPTRSGRERLNALFGRSRYVRIVHASFTWFVTTPAEAEHFLASCSPEERASLKVADVYLTPDAYEVLGNGIWSRK